MKMIAILTFFLLGLSSCDSKKKTVSLKTFSDVLACEDGLQTAKNNNAEVFVRKDAKLGLIAPHGFNKADWSENNAALYLIAGGITAAYIDSDCWPDIILAGGDRSGIVPYLNRGFQKGFVEKSSIISGTIQSSLYKHFTGVSVADLTGNYRRELLFGNLFSGSVSVLSLLDESNIYYEIDRLPVSRSTYSISFADINGNGFLDAFFAHWGLGEVDNTSPALWINSGNGKLLPFDEKGGTSHTVFDQRFNFTPLFGDLRGSGLQDLLVVSDFETSSVLQNKGHGLFDIVTNREIIKDEAGMGGALGDINNNGKLDWFVTSIYGENYSLGNRLYKNESNKTSIKFSDITDDADVKDGGWGWASCMADFNKDGFLDIFHVNGYVPEEVKEYPIDLEGLYEGIDAYSNMGSRLFINNGDGTFTNATTAWGLDVPSEGRGVICFDYDRDGDIDIALVDHSTGIQFFENQTGHGKGKRFLNIRLVGEAPNTDAIGSKVFVTADVGNGHGRQRQMRVSNANSNFNSQNLPDIHFGVGEAKSVDYLRIEWTDGSGLLCENVTSNQFLIFDQRDKSWPKSDSKYPDCHWYESINSVLQG